MTPYYQDATVTLYLGDAFELLASLDAEMAVTDPPYNFDKQYGTHDDAMSVADYAAWCRCWFDALRLVTKRQLVFPGHGNIGMWMKQSRPSSIGCWFKPGNPASSHLGWDEWEPYFYWGTRVGGSSVFRAPVKKQRDTGDHPCPKPISLMRQVMGKFKPVSVLDPFAGSGSTLKAAKDYGIPAIGIEIEERYCEIAAKRLAQEVLAL